MRTIYSEQAATDLANRLTDPNTQLYWLERDLGTGGQALLRRAVEIAQLEVREIQLDLCYPIDLEDVFSKLPDKPGVIILNNYDKSDMFVVSLITFTMLYYEYRRMLSLEVDSISISPKWKFIITTAPGAWINTPALHQRLCKLA